MSSTYVTYLPGQTLTSKELNDNFVFGRDQGEALGRLLGFGISCGLNVAVEGAAAVVSPGLGLDQLGRPVLLPAAVAAAIPPVVDATAFPFIDAALPGFTAVLYLRETIAAAPPCGQADCAGHGELVTREPTLVWVPGRLRTTPDRFASDPVHDLDLLSVRQDGSVVGDFAALRNGLLTNVNRLAALLGDRFEPGAAAKLQSLAQANSDLAFAKAMKAGLLNQVLLATIELARCVGGHGVCLRTDSPAGLALGWLEPLGAGFAWRHEFRHVWEVPTGQAAALLGGTGDEPCVLVLREIEALILAFQVPPAPSPGSPGTPGDPPIDTCILGKRWRFCRDLPLFIDDDLKKKLKDWIKQKPPRVPDRLGPIWNPPDILEELGQPLPMAFDTTVIHIDRALGYPGETAKRKLVDLAVANGLSTEAADASVIVVSQAGAEAIPGFTVQGFASFGDRIVLVQDAQGKVVNMGHVPVAATVRDVGVTVPAAVAKVGEAVKAVDAFKVETAALASAQKELGSDMVGVKAFQTRLETTLGDGGIDGFKAFIGTLVDTRLDHEVPSRVAAAVEPRFQRIEGQLDILGRRDAVTRERANLGLRTARTVGDRVDNAFLGSEGRQAVEQTLNERVLGLLGNFTQTIRATAPDDRRAAVDEALKPADSMLHELQDAVASGGGVFQSEQETLLRITETMYGALKATGANPSSLRKVRSGIQSLKGLDRVTDVVVDRMAIHCRAPSGTPAARVERVRRTWARVASRLLADELEACLADLDPGTTVVVDRVHVAFDIDGADYDDDVLAALWAERIRTELVHRLVEAAAIAGPVAPPGQVPRAAEPTVRSPGVGSGRDPVARTGEIGTHGVNPEHAGPWPPDDAGTRPVIPAASMERHPAPAPRRPVDASAVTTAGGSPGSAPEQPEQGAVRRVDTRARAALDGVVPDPMPEAHSARAPSPPRPESAEEAPTDRTPGVRPANSRALSVDAPRTAARGYGTIDPGGEWSSAGGLVLLYPWLGGYLGGADDRVVAIARLFAEDPGPWLDDPLVALLSGAASEPRSAPDVAERMAPEEVLQRFAAALPGFAESSVDYLRANLLVRGARVERLSDSLVRIRLAPHPLDPIVRRLPYPIGMFALHGTPVITVEWPP